MLRPRDLRDRREEGFRGAAQDEGDAVLADGRIRIHEGRPSEARLLEGEEELGARARSGEGDARIREEVFRDERPGGESPGGEGEDRDRGLGDRHGRAAEGAAPDARQERFVICGINWHFKTGIRRILRGTFRNKSQTGRIASELKRLTSS